MAAHSISWQRPSTTDNNAAPCAVDRRSERLWGAICLVVAGDRSQNGRGERSSEATGEKGHHWPAQRTRRRASHPTHPCCTRAKREKKRDERSTTRVHKREKNGKRPCALVLGSMHTRRAPKRVGVFLCLLVVVAAAAVVATAAAETRASDPAASPHLEGACEMVLDGATCRQRCACEWCPRGPDHGCHAVNLAGACGGEPGQRAPHDACYGDPAAGVEGLVVGGVFVGIALAVVGLWWGCRCATSMRRRFLNRQDRLLDQVGADKGDTIVDHLCVVDAGTPGAADNAPRGEPPATPSQRPASRPIDMPRPRVPIP